MVKHLTKQELQAGLPHILDSPADNGSLEGIVIRPAVSERRVLDSCEISLGRGQHYWLDLSPGLHTRAVSYS